MADSRKKSVGVIGLGIIGSRVAASLRRAGYPVVVWNRSPRPEPNFLASAREVSDSADIIQLFVRDGEALLEVVRSMLPKLSSDHLVMNHATVAPSETMEAARLVSEAGATFLDAPFTGSRDAAAVGELVYYVGGDDSALESARAVLEASSKVILHTGPIGSATYIKLATNMISAAQVEALAEALALLECGGVPLASLRDALSHNVANSGVIAAKLPLMLSGDFAPRFSVKNMLKDLRLALLSMRGTGIDLPATAATAGALMGAVQSGWARMILPHSLATILIPEVCRRSKCKRMILMLPQREWRPDLIVTQRGRRSALRHQPNPGSVFFNGPNPPHLE
jgi:3-hydroxyisobutyrate dehydrogenase-like beta-hydroxyacid dehydrogenase